MTDDGEEPDDGSVDLSPRWPQLWRDKDEGASIESVAPPTIWTFEATGRPLIFVSTQLTTGTALYALLWQEGQRLMRVGEGGVPETEFVGEEPEEGGLESIDSAWRGIVDAVVAAEEEFQAREAEARRRNLPPV